MRVCVCGFGFYNSVIPNFYTFRVLVCFQIHWSAALPFRKFYLNSKMTGRSKMADILMSFWPKGKSGFRAFLFWWTKRAPTRVEALVLLSLLIANTQCDLYSTPRFPFSEAKVTCCSAFAVICRLKSYTYSTHGLQKQDFICRVPEYPDVTVTIPASVVHKNGDFQLTLKV